MIKIKFKAIHVPRLDLFRAETDIRYYLAGIRIERAPAEAGGGLYLVACCGHTMVCIHDITGTMEGCDSALMRVTKDLVRVCGSKPTKASKLSVENVVIVDKRVSVAADFGAEHTEMESYVMAGNPWIGETEKMRYPDWRRVLPDFKKLKIGMVSPINARYLARFSQMRPENGGRHNYSEVRAWHESNKSVTTFQHMGIPEAIALIMPVRDFDNSYKDFNDKPFRAFPQKVDPVPLPAAQPQDSAPA